LANASPLAGHLVDLIGLEKVRVEVRP
jgi:hypothetical protein